MCMRKSPIQFWLHIETGRVGVIDLSFLSHGLEGVS